MQKYKNTQIKRRKYKNANRQSVMAVRETTRPAVDQNNNPLLAKCVNTNAMQIQYKSNTNPIQM